MMDIQNPFARTILRQVAQRANQGPWRAVGGAIVSETCGAGVYDDTGNVAAYGGPLVAESMHANNAAFVAAFDPPTVLAMLNRLEELECRADALAAVESTGGADE